MKCCTKCGVEKALEEFSANRRSRSGLQPKCKECNAAYHRANRDRILRRSKFYRVENRDVLLAGQSAWYQANREIVSEKAKQKRTAESPDERQSRLNRMASYRAAHVEEIREYQRQAYQANPQAYIAKARAYLDANRDKINAHLKRRKSTDPLFALTCSVRSSLSTNIRSGGYCKGSRSESIIGCSFAELKRHLEKQFSRGMSWSNYGEWHIDHRIPLASAKTEEELLYLCHYRNLQPLWAKENIQKADKLAPNLQLHLLV